MSKSTLRSSTLCWAALALAAPLAAQTQIAKLLPSDPANWAAFSAAVAIDGDVAVVGAPDKAVNGLNYAGTVYVFRRQTGGSWLEEARLVRPNPEIHDQFGRSVAVHGDLLVAGAPDFPYSSFTGRGAVYVYRRTSGAWIEEAELHGSTSAIDSGFGRAVALDGTTILTGANLYNGGSCAVFDYNGQTWGETSWFQAPSGKHQWDGFGAALALQGDVALVGAYGLDAGGILDAGKAFVYRRSGTSWSLEAELTAPTPDDGEWFGRPVALDGDLVVVGVPKDQVNGLWNAGSVFVYRQGGAAWTYEKRLLPPFSTTNESFGAAVAAHGDVVLAGGPGANLAGSGSGAAYVFRHGGGGWSADPPFAPADAGPGHEFGRSAAFDGLVAVIGAGDSPPGYSGLGSAYLYLLDAPLVLELDPLPPSAGLDADLIVRQGNPNAAAWVGYSLSGPGSTYIPPLDVTVGIANPQLLVGPRLTNAQGQVSWTLPVPAGAAGRAVWLQAVQYRRSSNVVATVVQ